MKQLLLSILLFLLFISLVSAHSIEDTVLDSGDVQTKITITSFVSQLEIPSVATTVVVTGSTFSQEGTTLFLDDCTSCTITYVLPDMVTKESSQIKSYSRNLAPFAPLTYSILLPVGYVLNETQDTVVPQADLIETNGYNIVIVWNITTLNTARYYVQFADHDYAEESASEITHELSEWQVIVLLVVALVIGILIGYRLRKVQREHVVVEDLLSPDEKTLLEAINKLHASSRKAVSQKELGTSLSWSKSKVSSVIALLSQKKLVQREKVGRNYYVTPLSKTISAQKAESMQPDHTQMKQ